MPWMRLCPVCKLSGVQTVLTKADPQATVVCPICHWTWEGTREVPR